MMAGIMAIIVLPAISPQSIYSSKYRTMPMGTVMAFFRVRVKAKRNSFQEKRKARIAPAKIPGRVMGSNIKRNVLNLDAPSTFAASYISWVII